MFLYVTLIQCNKHYTYIYHRLTNITNKFNNNASILQFWVNFIIILVDLFLGGGEAGGEVVGADPGVDEEEAEDVDELLLQGHHVNHR